MNKMRNLSGKNYFKEPYRNSRAEEFHKWNEKCKKKKSYQFQNRPKTKQNKESMSQKLGTLK